MTGTEIFSIHLIVPNQTEEPIHVHDTVRNALLGILIPKQSDRTLPSKVHAELNKSGKGFFVAEELRFEVLYQSDNEIGFGVVLYRAEGWDGVTRIDTPGLINRLLHVTSKLTDLFTKWGITSPPQLHLIVESS